MEDLTSSGGFTQYFDDYELDTDVIVNKTLITAPIELIMTVPDQPYEYASTPSEGLYLGITFTKE